MSSEKITHTVRLVYFEETIKNKGNSPEVFYDCMGMPVHILPGETGTVRRVRREIALPSVKPNPVNPTNKDSVDGEKQKQSKGKNS